MKPFTYWKLLKAQYTWINTLWNLKIDLLVSLVCTIVALASGHWTISVGTGAVYPMVGNLVGFVVLLAGCTACMHAFYQVIKTIIFSVLCYFIMYGVHRGYEGAEDMYEQGMNRLT